MWDPSQTEATVLLFLWKKQHKHFKRKNLNATVNFYTQVYKYLVKFSVFLKYLDALIKQLSSTLKTE